jgi:hypothetical protein
MNEMRGLVRVHPLNKVVYKKMKEGEKERGRRWDLQKGRRAGVVTAISAEGGAQVMLLFDGSNR